MSRSSVFNVISIGIFAVGVVLFFQYHAAPELSSVQPVQQLSNAESSMAISTATSTPVQRKQPVATSTVIKKSNAPSKSSTASSTATQGEATRIQNPYSTPAQTFDQINTNARAAVVNILCEPRAGGSLRPISGSGVLIDPHGVILTNAHVAQYVLLSESPQIDLSCVIRTGSPANAQWKASVLYIPSVWVNLHASEILDAHPVGTGEHDYALLYITGPVEGASLPSTFPYLPFDTRQAIAFPGDKILVASYPAEFVGGIAARYDLYSNTSITTVKQLLTFQNGTPDLLSLGGVIEAQSGSSGGAIVNAWNYLVALIATTSEGSTTADRDLRAVSLSYIDSDLTAQTGIGLRATLAGNLQVEVQDFTQNLAPQLISQYITSLSKNSQ